MSNATKEQGTAASEAATPVADVAASLDAIGISAPAAASGLSAVDLGLQAIIGSANGLQAAAAHVADVQSQSGAPTTGGAPRGHAAGGQAIGTFIAGEQGRELITTDRNLAVLNNKTTEQIMAALQQYIPGGSSSGRAGNTNIVNNTNIVPSQAVADTLGYRTAAQLRAMG